MKSRIVALLVVLAGCGAQPEGSHAVGAPLGDEPAREAPNTCGSPIERDLASLAVFVAEEMGHWDASNDFELDPVSGDLRISASGLARCIGDCVRTRSILALQASGVVESGHEPGTFKQAVLAAWNLQRSADAAVTALEPFRLARVGREPGGCGVMYWYDATLAGCEGEACAYADSEALARRLTFAGYPANPYLHFQTAPTKFGRTGALVGLDPSDGTNVLIVDGYCYRLRTNTGWYLDAYTSEDGDVVTREYQANDTQTWCFSAIPGVPNVFRIQHQTFSGQSLDAFTSSNGYKAVLRNFQVDSTQHWEFTPGTDGRHFYLKQLVSNRWLEASTSSADDYRAFTSTSSSSNRRFWLE
jgi:hypothetical protein